MLRIKKVQQQALAEIDFVERTMAHLRWFNPESIEGLDDEVLRDRVRHAIERGRSHGLTWEYSLTVFVAHMFEICPDFDEHPAVRRVLADPSLPPDERVDELLARVTDDEWEEIDRGCDAAAYWRRVEAGPVH